MTKTSRSWLPFSRKHHGEAMTTSKASPKSIQSEMPNMTKNKGKTRGTARARSLLDAAQERSIYAAVSPTTKQRRVSSTPSSSFTDSSTTSSNTITPQKKCRDEVRSPTSSLSPIRRGTSPRGPSSILHESSFSSHGTTTDDSSSSILSHYPPFSFFSSFDDGQEDSLLIESSFSTSSSTVSPNSANKQVAFSQNGAEVRYFSRSNSELQKMRQFSAEERERRRRHRKRQLRSPEITGMFHQLFTDLVALVHSDDEDDSSSVVSSRRSISPPPAKNADNVQPWFPFQCGVPSQCTAPEV